MILNRVLRLESSAANLADSINHGGLPAAGTVAPSFIEVCTTPFILLINFDFIFA